MAKRPKRTKAEIEMDEQAIVDNFDRLPDDSLVRIRPVAKLRACSPATVWRDVKAGRFVKPVQISPGVVAWNVGAIRRELRGAK